MNILGIRFRPQGQTYYFSATLDVALGSLVVVETEQGLGLGEVTSQHETLPVGAVEGELAPVLRLANDEDRQIGRDNVELGRLAHVFCQDCIRQRKLEMKLVDVEVYYDRSKIIFYFTAPARIDFRELVKDLVREYRSRIELRQIGVRHETQMVGAVGNCGMVCCCRRFLRKFAPVTIRMAKEQNLFLNPAKISGICGRLLCCLSYEQDNYDAFHRNCPRLGKKYQTNQGGMKVLRANMFRNSISALSESNEELEFTLEEWQGLEPRRPEQAAPPKSPPKAFRPQASSPNGDNGLLVVSVTPENVDDLLPFDAMLPEVLPEPERSSPRAAETVTEKMESVEAVQTDEVEEEEENKALVLEDEEAHVPVRLEEGGVFGLAPRRAPAAVTRVEPAPGQADARQGDARACDEDRQNKSRRKRRRRPQGEGE